MTIAQASRAAAAALLLAVPLVSRAAPPNDNFASAAPATAVPFVDAIDVTGATIEPGEQQFCSPTTQTVWYAFTPAQSGVVRFQATMDNFTSTSIAVYTIGGGFGNLTFVNCSGFAGPLALPVEANTTYYVQVGTFTGGILTTSIDALLPPPNDDFANATVVRAIPFLDTVDSSGASQQAGEPVPSCGAITGGTVWYRYTASATGSISASATTSFPSVVAAYTGGAIDALTPVACSFAFGPATLRAIAGTTYWFQVGSLFGTSPSLTFRLEPAPPPVASFSFFPFDPSVFDTLQFFDTSFDPANAGLLPPSWSFGDGAAATGFSATHRYAADGDYLVGLAVSTVDGRAATTSRIVQVRTHDVAITRLSAPQSASVGQTRSLAVDVRNTRYPEVVEVQLLRSSPAGYQLVGTLRQSVPVRPSGRPTPFAFSYTFTAEDAALGKVTFRAVATLVGDRDALPLDNEAISTPATRVR